MARPKTHPADATATDRLRASRAALAQRGGRIVQLRLEPEEAAQLARLRTEKGFATDRDAIVHALGVALRRR